MKFRCGIILAVVMLVGASTLMAQSPEFPGIRVNVPFAFRVGQQFMPAGQYQVAHFNAHDLVLILSMNGERMMLSNSVRSGKPAESTAKLVFNRYGETYFLRQVWIPLHDTNELVQSKTEKEYASRWGEPTQIAVLAAMNK